MKISCRYCEVRVHPNDSRPKIVHHGKFYRKSDKRRVVRYLCLACERTFSSATTHPEKYQKKRTANAKLREMLCSGVSQRRAAKLLKLNRKTVVRKFLFLAENAKLKLQQHNSAFPPVDVVEFDDIETLEHTKCKPISITLAVDSKSRRILGVEVSKMPAKGKLVHLARRKYGPRPDERKVGRKKLFTTLAPLVTESAKIKSDENPHYTNCVKEHLPKVLHEAHKGRRSCIVGQGELKKIGFDPLFSLNHTCAMFRANVNRLFRRTWNTTKKVDRLYAHLILYADYHNRELLT